MRGVRREVTARLSEVPKKKKVERKRNNDKKQR
jgi:hypothetical protein